MKQAVSVKSLALLLSLAAAPALLPGCSYSYKVQFSVTIAPEVEIPEGTSVGLVLVVSETRPELVTLSARSLISGPKDQPWTGEEHVCCAPDPVVWNFAFLDLNDDGSWDEGEPIGEDPKNPVTLKDDEHSAAIRIEKAPD